MIGRHPEGRGGALIGPGRLASWLRGAAEKNLVQRAYRIHLRFDIAKSLICPCKQPKTLNNFKTIIQFRQRTRPRDWSHEGGCTWHWRDIRACAPAGTQRKQAVSWRRNTSGP